MKFEIGKVSITALIDDPRRSELVRLDVSELSVIPKEKLLHLLDVCVSYGFGKKSSSLNTFVAHVLRPFGRYLHSDVAKASLPVDFYEWQFLTLQFGLWYISHPLSDAKLEWRCRNWQWMVCPWLQFLQEEGWIPLGVTWPDLRLPSETVPFGVAQKIHLLGEISNREMDNKNVMEFIDKTIVGPIFWRSDVEYLDEIEITLRKRDKILGETLLDYWTKLVVDYRTGKRLLSYLSEQSWMSAEEVKWRFNSTRYFTSARYIDGHIWTLRFLRQQIDRSNDVGCLTRSTLRAHPAAAHDFLKSESATAYRPLINLSALTKAQSAFLSPRHILNRFSGVLNNTDFSVALALLISEHPNLNPSSLAGAKVVNERNKSHLVVYGESEALIFSVDKPRAKSRKYAVFSRRASQIFKHILRVTAPVRALLQRANNPHWRYLFLGDIDQGSLGHPREIRPDLLTTAKGRGVSLLNLYPYLAESGLIRDTVNFSKIRNTKGVLEWFDTGSVQAVAKTLGNSPRTVIQHYLPASLIVMWNERIVRCFQNTLLVLAAKDEEWMLDVVDMPNVEELNRFLTQLVYDLPFGSSPIADKVHEYFNPDCREEASSFAINRVDALLQIRLSASSLALLLAYRHWALRNLSQEAQQRPDKSTGHTPKYFIDLAGMLQGAVQSADIGARLRESLDVARLQKCYENAVPLIPNFLKKIARFTIHSNFEV
jgi:hypothetical protein